MIREECKIGMVVEFGRNNGEWTKGEIVKLNPTKAKVKTLEARGSGRGGFVGAEWGVPYSMIRPVGGTTVVREEPLNYNRFRDRAENLVIEAIVSTYHQLEPEWLTADGERPIHQVHALRSKLNTRLSHLFRALGRTVSEEQAFGWSEQKQKEEAA
jgi:hypothetical protein